MERRSKTRFPLANIKIHCSNFSNRGFPSTFRRLFRWKLFNRLTNKSRSSCHSSNKFLTPPSSERVHVLFFARVYYPRADALRAGTKIGPSRYGQVISRSLCDRSLSGYPYCAYFSKGILRLATLMCIFKPLSGKRSMEQNSLQVNRNGIFP